VVSLLCYFLCAITVLTAVAVGMVSLSHISERVGHYPHPRPAVERNDRELRLFMVVPKTKHGSPANKEAHSAAVPPKKLTVKKEASQAPKRSPVSITTTNDLTTGTHWMTLENPRTGQVAYSQLVTQIGDN